MIFCMGVYRMYCGIYAVPVIAGVSEFEWGKRKKKKKRKIRQCDVTKSKE